VRCHKAEKQGGDVGPALDGIGVKRDRSHLLESIVHPDAKVDEQYRTTVIVTDAGKTVAGIVVSEDGTELKLKTPDAKIETIPVASIDERTSGPSAMPADLAGKLTRREFRDLLEWLGSLK
jgi:quinoprotein glucose dehydrogenase